MAGELCSTWPGAAEHWQRGLDMGDIRLDRMSEHLTERAAQTGSLVVKKLGATRAGEVAAGRFLANPNVDPAMILEPAIARTRAACAGRTIVVAQDTTEINFAGRGARRKGLGPAGDGASPGFFIHPQVAIDAEAGAVLGLVGAEFWTRPEGKAGDRKKRPAADKESRRWSEGARVAGEQLAGTRRPIVVGDRECDMFGLFANRPEGVDLLVRANHDRALDDGRLLKAAANGWPVLATYTIEVPARRIGAAGGPKAARTARVAIRSGTVTIKRPRRAERGDPPSVKLGLVAVTEIEPPVGIEPVAWWLLTTLDVAGAAAAREVVRLYRLRWRIEEVFRALKTDGLDLEASQVTQATSLLNQAAIGLLAAVRIVQLVDARDGSSRPATDVVDADEIPAVAAIGKPLEGKTRRQQNPHAKGSLAWVAWIAARLGGWNCYYRKPGPKTMAAGWKSLCERLQGFDIARRLQHV